MSHKNLIAGEWVSSAEALTDINPSDIAETVGEYQTATATQVEDAINAARSALPAYRAIGIQMRADVLNSVADELHARSEELGRLLSREEGKVLADGIGEVIRAAHVFRYFAGEAVRNAGVRIPSLRDGVDVQEFAEPVGVVGLITPWNYPIAILAHKIAPALAYGNTVILKPSEIVPASAWALTEIISRTDLPPGTFNLVMGGGEVGARISNSPGVDAVSFTGSSKVGCLVRDAVTRRGGSVQLELGGKNPLIVLADADLDRAADCAVSGAFYQTGQRCTASSRLVVEKAVHDPFVEKVVQRMNSLRVGNALDPDSDIGPVVDDRQLAVNHRFIRIGLSEGARKIGPESEPASANKGYYFNPVLFTETDNTMLINREEIFGPIASVIPAENFEHAMMIANDTSYGLSAGICTSSRTYARAFLDRIESGVRMINMPTSGIDYHVPFGGLKASGFGPREIGREAREFFTRSWTSYELRA